MVAPEEPGRRERARKGNVHEDPPVIPVEDELPMDPFSVELRVYLDEIGRGLNHNNMTLEYMMSHMNIPDNDSFSDYSLNRNWDERWSVRQSGAGGSGYGSGDDEDEE